MLVLPTTAAVVFAVGIPAVVADHTTSDDASGWDTVVVAVSLLAVGRLAGMLFRRTMAGAAIGLLVGGTRAE